MVWFFLKRLMRAFITVFMVTMVIFILIRVVPGDPVRMMVSGTAPDSAVKQLRKELGLDKPILVQFGVFLKDAIKGDLGESFFRSKSGGVGQSVGGSSKARLKASKEGVKGLKDIEKQSLKRASVLKLILDRFPLTLALIGVSLIMGLGVGFILAVLGQKNQKIGSAFEVLTVLLGALPNFWLAIMAIFLFSTKLKLLPGVGFYGWRSLILPSSVLAITIIPATYKVMLETLRKINNEEFMIALEARGVKNSVIIAHKYKHFLASIITFLGLQWGPLFGGAIIIEYLFSIQGMGTLFMYAVLQRDYPLIVGGVIILSILFVSLNFIVDIVYGYLDSRVREW